MEVKVFLAADYANVTSDGKLNVMGVFSHINASSFPAVHPSMYLVAQLEVGLGEDSGEKRLTIKYLDEDGNELGGFSRDIDMPQGVGETPPQINHILEIRGLGLPHPGLFQFSLYVDNDLKKTLPLSVNQITLKE